MQCPYISTNWPGSLKDIQWIPQLPGPLATKHSFKHRYVCESQGCCWGSLGWLRILLNHCCLSWAAIVLGHSSGPLSYLSLSYLLNGFSGLWLSSVEPMCSWEGGEPSQLGGITEGPGEGLDAHGQTQPFWVLWVLVHLQARESILHHLIIESWDLGWNCHLFNYYD